MNNIVCVTNMLADKMEMKYNWRHRHSAIEHFTRTVGLLTFQFARKFIFESIPRLSLSLYIYKPNYIFTEISLI